MMVNDDDEDVDEQATPTFTYQHGTPDISYYSPLEHAYQIW